MSLLISAQPNKPNRLDSERYPDKDSNKDYHLDYAKWAVGSAQTTEYFRWLASIKVNKEFYKGDQWVMKEDIEAFLKDSTGQEANRIKIVHNIIRPMVEQYRGNASILKVNATAKSISKLSVNRRETDLSRKIFDTQLANEFAGLGEIMRKNDKSIGKNEEETTQIFENLYVDLYVSQMNSLLKYVKNLNKFDRNQIKYAQNLALTGLVVSEAFEHGGHLRFRAVESEDFIWDTDARELDLSDAAFMGYVNPMDVSTVGEKWQITPRQMESLENYVSSAADSNVYTDTANTRKHKNSRVPVYKVFWRDTMRKEYGYVLDDYDYPYLTRINYTHPGEEEPRYTDADLIEPPKSPKNKKLFKGKKKRMMYVDYIRFCTFIPGEVVGKAQEDDGTEPENFDIVLDYGIDAYQETELLDLGNVKFPLKCQTWGYVDGEVFSPVDDAINPQRFINRVMSVTEQLINNSGGSGPVIDEDAIAPGTKDQTLRDMKEGRPVTVRTRGKGVPNTVGYYDMTPKAGVYNMFNIIPILKQNVQDTTGVNEALRGESTGSDQLVGVTELLIQRGSLMQEPFYNAITDLYVQKFQYAATCGKRMYIDNERELAIITGDEGVDILTMSKDLRNEDFRVFVSRENDDAVLKSQANQMLMLFLEQQLIDDKVFANLYNRSTPDEVTMALRSQAGLRAEAARRAAEENQQAQNQAVAEAKQIRDEDRQDKKYAIDSQERISDKQIQGKSDDLVTKSLLDGHNNS